MSVLPQGARPPAFDTLQFRHALSQFATGVTVITGKLADDTLFGVTINSFNSVSLDPPLVLFSIANTARSLRSFLEAPGFAVNVLRKDQKRLASRFARQGIDKWAGVDYEPGRFGAPLLPGTMAAFDCLHYAQYEGGDHLIIVGRVVAMEHDVEGDPLLFYRGRYCAIGEEIS